MDAKSLEHYLYEHIPLSKAMGVEVRSASCGAITLAAPLAPNINHRETVFGGSASALAILAARSLLYVRLKAEGMGKRIVIHSNTMERRNGVRLGCGWAMLQILAGVNPVPVTASHGPGIEPGRRAGNRALDA